MMLSLKDAYGNDAVLKLFPKPDYSHISSDIVVGDLRLSIPYQMNHEIRLYSLFVHFDNTTSTFEVLTTIMNEYAQPTKNCVQF